MNHRIMNQLLYKISAYCRCRIISGNDGQPYLERYHLFSLPFGIQCYLHRFIAGDPGKALHNHPWKAAASFILSGQYIETRLTKKQPDLSFKKRQIKAGSINWINGDVYHRIDLEPKQQVWSLFMHSKKQEQWGFIEHQHQHFAYQDHNELVQNHNNAQWWKSADKPKNNPLMRQPLNNKLKSQQYH